ncbi:hypothetical protein NE865_02762 [Phthorimaea operculella]|nr:hypothetical protein NE865_02762 [Phthorimaea operculella]
MLRRILNKTLRRLKSRSSLGYACRYSSISDKVNPRCNPQEAGEDKVSEEFEEPGELTPPTPTKEESERLSRFRNKLKEDLAAMEMNRFNLMVPKENDPLPPWPNNVNPHTGEIGGPRGPEPTRYGDWERKGICIDF